MNYPETDEGKKEPTNDEIKSENFEKNKEEIPSSSDKNVDEEFSVSKLNADALSASSSSSKCLLKGNRDDLDPDIDSGGEGTSKHGSKLKSSELLASMSSSKCLLKRCIEKVVESETNTEEEADASESKKTNCAEDHFSSSQPVGSVIIMSSGTSSCTDTIKGVGDDSISVKKAWIDKMLTEIA